MIDHDRQRQRQAWPSLEGGQAMAEFAIIAAALMGGLMVMSFEILPSFIEAFQVYLNGFYAVLHLPIP